MRSVTSAPGYLLREEEENRGPTTTISRNLPAVPLFLSLIPLPASPSLSSFFHTMHFLFHHSVSSSSPLTPPSSAYRLSSTPRRFISLILSPFASPALVLLYLSLLVLLLHHGYISSGSFVSFSLPLPFAHVERTACLIPPFLSFRLSLSLPISRSLVGFFLPRAHPYRLWETPRAGRLWRRDSRCTRHSIADLIQLNREHPGIPSVAGDLSFAVAAAAVNTIALTRVEFRVEGTLLRFHLAVSFARAHSRTR